MGTQKRTLCIGEVTVMEASPEIGSLTEGGEASGGKKGEPETEVFTAGRSAMEGVGSNEVFMVHNG